MSSEQAIGEQTGAATKARPLQTTSAQAGGGHRAPVPSRGRSDLLEPPAMGRHRAAGTGPPMSPEVPNPWFEPNGAVEQSQRLPQQPPQKAPIEQKSWARMA
jgi:hypothetical protein